jgi:hypothetical protein
VQQLGQLAGVKAVVLPFTAIEQTKVPGVSHFDPGGPIGQLVVKHSVSTTGLETDGKRSGNVQIYAFYKLRPGTTHFQPTMKIALGCEHFKREAVLMSVKSYTIHRKPA